MLKIFIGSVVGIYLWEKSKNYNFVRKIKHHFDFEFTKIVQFNRDEYAIRRGALGIYFYKDLSLFGEYWWSKFDSEFEDCLGSLKKCQECFDAMKERSERAGKMKKSRKGSGRQLNKIKEIE